MAPSGEDMMVSFMVGERMSDYMYDWMSGGAEAMVMINANLVPDASAMEGMMGSEGARGPAGPAGDMGPEGTMGSEGAQGAPRARRAKPVPLALTAPSAPTERRALPVLPVELAPLVLRDRWGSSR